MLAHGQAQGATVISAGWMQRMQNPCALAPFYGYLVWLNHERKVFPSLPSSSYFGMGAGGHFTLVEPHAGLVAVVRWINPDRANEFFGKVYRAVS